MRTDHVNTTPTLSTTVYIMSILFLPFSPWVSSYVCINCHIRKCAQTTSPVHQHCQQQYLRVYSSLFFPDFVTIFVVITIFGNAHRPCEHYSNIVHNSLHHVYSFFLFFSDFLAIFALLTIFGNVHRPCKQYPNIVNNSLHHVCSFFLFFSLFFLIFWLYLRRLPY